MVYKTLVDVEAVRRHLDAADWRVFDCRCSPSDSEVGRRKYLEGHIPGARHADLDRVLAAEPGERTGRHPLPDRRGFAAWLGREGVGKDTQIVACDDNGGAFAARLWWLARWLGHRAAAVLDGGLEAWCESGARLVSGAPETFGEARFPVRKSLVSVVDTDEVLAIVAGQAPGTLVDARAAARYRGEQEPIDSRTGHIPGACNRPFAGNLDDQGRFLARDRLRRRFVELAADPRAVVSYCGSGVTACHNVLAMEHAGLHGARLYAGSWSEWIRDPRRPVSRAG